MNDQIFLTHTVLVENERTNKRMSEGKSSKSRGRSQKAKSKYPQLL